MSTDTGVPLLRLNSICKSFSKVNVLHDISLDIRAGEVLGILGENGAGKSTLLKIIDGIYHATSGSIEVEGKTVNIRNPSDAKKHGIAMIPQEFNLVSTLNVFENVFLGQELRRSDKFGSSLLNKRLMREKTHQLLELLDTPLSPDSIIEDLTVAEKQMVEIAKALVNDARILIMDEPTTVLTHHEVDVLFTLINKLKQQGVTILFISHKLKEVKQLCDRLIILRDGELVSIDEVSQITEHDIATKMVGRELNQIFPEKNDDFGQVALEVDKLTLTKLVKDVSFSVRCGEVLGFGGLVGSGRTEIAESLMGLRAIKHGQVQIFSQQYQPSSVSHAISKGLAYMSEDRQGSGLILNFNLFENITLCSLKDYKRLFIDHSKTKQKAKQYINQFDIKTENENTELQFLSGGNQQKVYLSKWMDTQPKILILDEPTRGVDVNTKKDIYHFIHTLTQQGLAVIVISSDMEELIGLSNRVIVMREGQQQGELTGENITEQNIMLSAAGLRKSQPEPVLEGENI
ncbi:ATP-binding cassette domain-containing protein [Vibrio astriarenae]|uniref:ATP-binding cassette domain-containing protein n=1 Tax=Vibrio astriarenae TaxID=1481923 RepID=A0A7Z2T6K6_9VIBR|nr:sugar ABC transporter ATP-binding protein [Vibrio astriarenae]QIA65338.1 ATP-binding cassette domain-containing protein [Vibrio astriarenae]